MSELKRIDQILWEMASALEATYGLKGVHKITVSHELFDAMVFDMAKHTQYKAYFRPSSMNDLEICGIRLEARTKK